MSITGYKKAYVAVLIGGNTFVYYEVKRDEGIIQPMIKIEQDFWNRVQNRIPPEIDGSDASVEFVNNLFKDSYRTSIVLPEDTLDLIRSYEETVDQIKDMNNRKEELANRMKLLLQENEEGTIGERKIKWLSVESERFDKKKLKEELPETYEKYISTIAYRRFSVV